MNRRNNSNTTYAVSGQFIAPSASINMGDAQTVAQYGFDVSGLDSILFTGDICDFTSPITTEQGGTIKASHFQP